MKYLFITITALSLLSCGGDEDSKKSEDSAMKTKVCDCFSLVQQMRDDQKAANGDLDKIDAIMKENEAKLKECRKFEEEVRAMSEEKRKEIEALAKECR